MSERPRRKNGAGAPFGSHWGSATWLDTLTTPQPFLVLGDKFHDGCLKMVADQAQLAHREAALPELDSENDALGTLITWARDVWSVPRSRRA